MMLRISSELLTQMHALAEGTPRQESCGLLLGSGHDVTAILAASNVAADPETRFEVDPAILISAHKQARAGGPSVVGLWHSHPNGHCHPSAEDARCAAPDGLFWLIIANGQESCWQAVDHGPVHGRFEPVALSLV